jgi:two-component system sensor histidine kinase QseC
LEEGFNYANFSGYRWRTLIKKGDGYRWAVVAERSDLRYILAEKVALESVTPLFLWLPLSAILVWLLVGIGMRPLRELSQQINLKRSDNLNPIIYDNPPQELVQLIDSTNSLLARLNASFEREKHFSSHAAHELRTPLSVIKVHLHNLAEDLAKDHQGLAHANAGIDRMHRLIEQILDLNRTHPDIIEANFKAIDLHKLVKQVTASAWPQFSARNQSLSLNGETVFIMGDEYMLETLLENLLNNANKYTPIDGEIEVSVTRTNGKARLQVADSGLGIPVEKRNHVFERFYRANSEKNSEATGSGLGLAIVKHIAQLHDATINLNHSRFPSGLLITIDFPLNEESPQ